MSFDRKFVIEQMLKQCCRADQSFTEAESHEIQRNEDIKTAFNKTWPETCDCFETALNIQSEGQIKQVVHFIKEVMKPGSNSSSSSSSSSTIPDWITIPGSYNSDHDESIQQRERETIVYAGHIKSSIQDTLAENSRSREHGHGCSENARLTIVTEIDNDHTVYCIRYLYRYFSTTELFDCLNAPPTSRAPEFFIYDSLECKTRHITEPIKKLFKMYSHLRVASIQHHKIILISTKASLLQVVFDIYEDKVSTNYQLILPKSGRFIDITQSEYHLVMKVA